METVDIEASVAPLGAGPLTEPALAAHVAPLFSRVRAAAPGRIYLANHSLGRPPDAVATDRSEDERRAGVAGDPEHVRRRRMPAGGRDARRVRFARRHPVRVRAPRRAIIADARGPYLRFCPDILTTDEEIVRAADALAAVAR